MSFMPEIFILFCEAIIAVSEIKMIRPKRISEMNIYHRDERSWRAGNVTGKICPKAVRIKQFLTEIDGSSRKKGRKQAK